MICALGRHPRILAATMLLPEAIEKNKIGPLRIAQGV